MKKIKVIAGIWCLVYLGWAQSTVPSLNQCPDMIFVESNESDSLPSGGSGGSFPGLQQRVVGGGQTYYIYIPSSYDPNIPMPLMALWSGAVFAGGGPAAAQDMIDLWQAEAETHGFIIVAQAIIGSVGCDPCGWIPVPDAQTLASIINDMESAYNIETTRRYVWGFSAGAHVMHAIALNNADFFAAYAVSAGDLDQYAIPVGHTPSNASRVIPVFVSVGNVDFLYAEVLNDRPDFIAGGWEVGRNYHLDEFSGGHILLNNLPDKAWDNICITTNLD